MGEGGSLGLGAGRVGENCSVGGGVLEGDF